MSMLFLLRARRLSRLQQNSYPIVLSDIYLDERTGLDVLQAAKSANPDCAVILMTGRGTMETVMRATQGGAFDYIAKPFELDRLLETLKRAENIVDESDDDSEVPYEELPPTEMIASSGPMVEIYKTISLVAPKDATVLVEGETGTGKELLARMIHRYSRRADQPFLAVDCGAIAPTLIESELFGAVRGAYTGSDRDRVGVFEAANHGTVFLDEIGEVDQSFQLKLLRFLQEREIRPVGAPRSKQIDVRVVAATNRDLHKLVLEGKFREDLWYRLAVIRIKMPPLRERHGDVPLLAQHFVERSNQRFGTSARLTESGVKTLPRIHLAGERPADAAPDRTAVYPLAKRRKSTSLPFGRQSPPCSPTMRQPRRSRTPKPTRSEKYSPLRAEISRALPRF